MKHCLILGGLLTALLGGCERGYLGRYEVQLSILVSRLKVEVPEARSRILEVVERFAKAQALTPGTVDENRTQPILLSTYHKNLPEGPLLSIQVYEGEKPQTLFVDVTELWTAKPSSETRRVELELVRALEDAIGKEGVSRLKY